MMKKMRRLLMIIVISTLSSIGLAAQVSIGDSTYATLKGAFDAVNAGYFTGNIAIEINDNTIETERAVLFASGASGASASYTSIAIYPTIEAKITGAVATALIELRDADNVTIDGRINREGSTNALTIENTQASSASVIWINAVPTSGNGPQNNTVRNVNIIGGSASTSTTYGIITGSSSSLTTGLVGAHKLKILNNNFMRSYYGLRVYSTTTEAGANDSLIVRNNTFGNNGTPGDGHYYALYPYGTKNAIIEDNVINVNATTVVQALSNYYGRYAKVRNNTVTGTSTSTFYATYNSNSDNSLFEGNIIRNCFGTTIYGLYNLTTIGAVYNNNKVINNNAGTLYLAYLSSGSNGMIKNNLIENNTATTSAYGIYLSVAGSQAHNNTVRNLSSTGIAYGIYTSAAADAEIYNNVIENIAKTGPSATTTAAGIYINTTSNNAKIFNNSIAGVYNAFNVNTVNYFPAGIRLQASTGHKLYNNSVHLFGQGAQNTAYGISAALMIQSAVVKTLDIRNNTFSNTLDGSPSASAYTVFVWEIGTIDAPTIWDNNNYYSAGSQGSLFRIANTGYPTLAAWRAAIQRDSNSINVDPLFNSDKNLRPYYGSSLIGQGKPLFAISTDLVGTTRSLTAPTIGAYEVAGDFEKPTINFVPLANISNLNNRSFMGGISDKTGVDTTSFKPRIYYKRASNANTYIDNTVNSDGWKYTVAVPGANNTFTFNIDYSKIYGGVNLGMKIQYFIVTQDISVNKNVAVSSGIFANQPPTVVLSATNFPITEVTGEYVVVSTLSGTIQVGEGKQYTSLTGPGGVFELLDYSSLNGNLNIEITSDLVETGEFPLHQITNEGGTYNINIYPTGYFTISGNTSPALIQISDADRVIIDGRMNMTGSNNALTFNNSSASGAVIWVNRNSKPGSNGSKNTTIRYCNVIGGSATSTSSYGILFGGDAGLSTGANGHDNALIEYNNVSRCYYGIRVYGVTDEALYNNGLIIKNNNLGNDGAEGDGHYYAIHAYYTQNAQLLDNNIKVNNTTIHSSVSNNYGINTIISGNTASGSISTSTFYGVYDGYSKNSNVYNNTVSNNKSTVFYGIDAYYSTNSNYHDNLVENNTGSSTFYPIYCYYGNDNIVNKNVVNKNTNTSTTYGIYVYYHKNGTVTNNLVKDLKGGSSTVGIYAYGGASTTIVNTYIANNTITNITKTGTSTTLFAAGIALYTYCNNSTILNNSISGVFDYAPKTNSLYMPAGIKIRGSAGTKIQYNSVNMYPSTTVPKVVIGNTAGLLFYDATSTGFNVRNNVFSNTFEGAPGSKSYAIYVEDTGILTGLTINYNDYFVGGTDGILGYFGADISDLATWKAATAQDANSISVEPVFNGFTSLEPFYNSPLLGKGTPITGVTKDLNGVTRSVTAPTIGAFELEGDFSQPEIVFTPLKNTGYYTSRTINAEITDRSGVNDDTYPPRIYFRKKSNANVLADNTSSTNGWKYTVATGTGTSFVFTIDYNLLFGGLSQGDEVEYFILAQDISTTHPVGRSSGTFSANLDNVNLTSAHFPVTKIAHSYKIFPTISGTIPVGEGHQYTSLTGANGAFAAIKGHFLVGNLNLEITSDLSEKGTVPLEAIYYAEEEPYFVYIYPTGKFTISDTTTTALIVLNDADRVVIDGRINRQGNERSLTLENASTTGACIWVNRGSKAESDGSNFVTIRNLNIIGGSSSTSTSYGIVTGGAATLTTAGNNDNLLIYNNDISRCYYGVRIYGSSSYLNKSPSVRNNKFGGAGFNGEGHYYAVYLYYAENALITDNAFNINSTTTVYNVYNYYSNYSDITGNKITNSTGTHYGFYLSGSDYCNVQDNSITNTSSSSTFYGYYSTSSDYITYSNNILYNCKLASTAYLFYLSSSNYNVVSNNSAEDISAGSTLYLIYGTSGSNHSYLDNTFSNCSTTSTNNGIYNTSSTFPTITGNTVQNSTSGGVIYGIYNASAPSAVITKNTIDNLVQTSGSKTTHASGIYIGTSSDNCIIANNSISGIFDAFNKDTTDYLPAGIRIQGSNGHKIYFNSVNMYGPSQATNLSTPGASAALVVNLDTANKFVIQNNIFVNTMSGSNGSKFYAIYLKSADSINSHILNYNDYYVNGSQTVMGYIGGDQTSLLSWQGLTGQDDNSVSIDPGFNNNRNLRPFDGSAILGLGIPIDGYPTDRLGETRDETAPALGAFETTGDFVAPSITFKNLENTSEMSNRVLTATIFDYSGVNNTTSPPILYYRKTSNENAFYDNTPGTDGWKYVVGTGSGFDFSFTIDHSLLYGGLEGGDQIEYFIVAQDNSANGFLSASGTTAFKLFPTNTHLTSANLPVTKVSTNYYISIPFAGIIDVGQGNTFTNLSNADGLFRALSTGILVGDLQIRITSDITNETGEYGLKQMSCENSEEFKIAIYPTNEYTVSGSSALAIIQLNDADRVTIDGRIDRTGSTNSLTIKNTAVPGAVIWVNRSNVPGNDGSKAVTIKHLNIIGGSPTTTTSMGIVAGSASALATGISGNDTLLIENNNIYRAYYGVRIIGLSGAENLALKVLNNNFGNNATDGDGLGYAISVSYAIGAVIDNNTISINNAGILCYPIYHYYSHGGLVKNNKIINCSVGAFYGIRDYYSQNATVSNNTIMNNSSTSFYGPSSYYAVGSLQINNRVENNVSSGTSYSLYSYLGSSSTFENNRVINNSGTTTYGAYIQTHPNATYRNNIIRNIEGTLATTGIYIYSTSTTLTSQSREANIIGNTIENIRKTAIGTSVGASGISLATVGVDSALIVNNTITGIFDVAAQISSANMPAGIRLAGSKGHTLLFNTVSLAGTSLNTTAQSNSAALQVELNSIVDLTIKNNIFSNTTLGHPDSKAYAVFFSSSASLAGSALDYNNYYTPGAQGLTAYAGEPLATLSDWKVFSSQDANTISVDPQFAGYTDLRPLTTSQVLGAGTPLTSVPMDKLGVVRSLTTPTIGAFEEGFLIGIPELNLPEHLAEDVSNNPTLSWYETSTATGYILQVATDNKFANLVFEGTVTELSKTLLLGYSTYYYWRVKAIRGSDQSAWSQARNFTTRPEVYVPELSYPMDKASRIPYIATGFVWESTVGANSYRIQVARDLEFTDLINNSVVSETTLTLELEPFTSYYWRVQGIAVNSVSDWSEIRNFETKKIFWGPLPGMADTVYIGTGKDSTYSYPMNRYYRRSTSEAIYLASEIGNGRPLTSLAFFKSKGTNVDPILNVDIYIKHTTSTTLATGEYSFDGYTKVFSGGFPNNLERGWMSVPFIAPFDYNGSDNLQILIIKKYQDPYLATAVAPYWQYTTVSPNKNRSAQTDTEDPITVPLKNLTTNANRPNIRFSAFKEGNFFPNLISPANDAMEIAGSSNLTWTDLTEALSYDVQLATDADFSNILANQNVNSTSIQLSSVLNVTNNTKYYWRVRGVRNLNESVWSEVWAFTSEMGTVQNIPLTNGWNMISANLVPQNTDMSTIVAPLGTKMIQIKDAYGKMYAPPFQASLSNWNIAQAYQVRMNVSETLTLSGDRIVPEATPITLNQLGWYWLPYYRTSSMATATALASISGKYLQIKNIQGQVYQPPFTTTLSELVPNAGYMIRMTATNGTLTYPANAVTKGASNDDVVREPSVFVRNRNITGKTAFIALDLNNMQTGDEVGVFTRDGMLVGSSVWQESNRGVVIWGDDEFTVAKDGAYEGEELNVKVWSNSTKSIGSVNQIALNDMTNAKANYTLTYETDGIHLLKGSAEILESSILVTPQPASHEVFVNTNITTEDAVDVKLYSQEGKLSLDTRAESNGGVIKLNTTELPSGVYQLILNINGKTYSEKVVIVK